MKLAYYPGCSLEGTAKSYDISARAVCRSLGVELEDAPDWTCCGSSPALKMNNLLSVSLSAYNLTRIASMELDEVVVPCPFCYRRLISARDEIKEDNGLKDRVQRVIEAEVQAGFAIHNLVGFLRHQVGLESIRSNVRIFLNNLKLAPYYGCYLVKPPKVTQFDDPENPTSMDDLMTALGADVLAWDFKTECCGAGLAVSKTEKVRELSGRLIREAVHRGADVLVVPCQLCHSNLDMREAEIGRQDGKDYRLPIVYFTQLLGLAFGLPPESLGLNLHIVDPLPVLKVKGLLQ